MTAREWQLGDVAIVRGDVCLRLQDGKWEHGRGDRFAYDRGQEARPLVVIDPEDREQVASLVELLIDNGWRCTTAHGLRDALREFADPKPPKPEEPTGLGAVVREADALRWYRMPASVGGWKPWACEDGRTGDRAWSDIDVVEVLSEGVTP